MQKEIKKLIKDTLNKPCVDLLTTSYYIEAARFYEYVQDLMWDNNVESKSHFMEMLQDNALNIVDKFYEIYKRIEKDEKVLDLIKD